MFKNSTETDLFSVPQNVPSKVNRDSVVLTSIKSVRVAENANKHYEFVHWSEPVKTQRLREQLRLKQVFQKSQKKMNFENTQPIPMRAVTVQNKLKSLSGQQGPPDQQLPVRSNSQAQLPYQNEQFEQFKSFGRSNDKPENVIQRIRSQAILSEDIEQNIQTAKLLISDKSQPVIQTSDQTQSKQSPQPQNPLISDAFQSYFAKPKNLPLTQKRRTGKTQQGMVIKSTECGQPLKDSHKYSTQEQRALDDFED